MIGDTYIDDHIEFVVVWSGGDGLIPDRTTKTTEFWVPPNRLYNKTGQYKKKAKEPLNHVQIELDKILE